MGKNIKYSNDQVRLLYWGWDIDAFISDPPHRHPFWQIEVITNGDIETTINEEIYLLEDNCIIVIPPENLHDFQKKATPLGSVFSFKFELNEFPSNLQSAIIPANDFSKHISNSLKSLLCENKKNRLLSSNQQIAIEYLLRDIVHYCFVYRKNTLVQDSRIIRELYEMINYQGKNINVESAAEALNCSTSFLKRYIKNEKGIPAKAFIDQECFKLIQGHLTYSSFNSTKIAEKMNFPDIYAFSRFFKRMSGMSPTQYRKIKK
jgi:AraC-like DNA-binding protein